MKRKTTNSLHPKPSRLQAAHLFPAARGLIPGREGIPQSPFISGSPSPSTRSCGEDRHAPRTCKTGSYDVTSGCGPASVRECSLQQHTELCRWSPPLSAFRRGLKSPAPSDENRLKPVWRAGCTLLLGAQAVFALHDRLVPPLSVLPSAKKSPSGGAARFRSPEISPSGGTCPQCSRVPQPVPKLQFPGRPERATHERRLETRHAHGLGVVS